jgi:hypothetical protein
MFGIFGNDPSDQGFVKGFSWRMMLGQKPYLDFIYPRPLLTVLLDYFFRCLSPLHLEVFLERVRFYYQMMAIPLMVFLPLSFVKHSHRFSLIIISYLLSLGAFPAASWYTMDGLFFAALAFSFFSDDSSSFRWCLFFAFCSALTKQSFYPLPLYVFSYGLLNWKKIKVIDFIIGMIPVLGFGIYLFIINGTEAFIRQTSGASRLSDLVDAGVLAYVNMTTIKYLVFFWLAFMISLKNKKYALIFLACVFGFDFCKFLTENAVSERAFPIKHFPKAVFILGFSYLMITYRRIDFFKLMFLLAIAWCSSLSWGYKTPALFMPGLLAIGYLVLNERASWLLVPKFLMTLLVMTGALYVIQNLNRHRQGKIWENNLHLGALNSRYTLIFTNHETFSLYAEMKNLNSQKQGVFLPAFSDSNYFLNKKPLLAADWISDIEIRNDAPKIESQLKSCAETIYLYSPAFHRGEYDLLYPLFEKMRGESVGKFMSYCP